MAATYFDAFPQAIDTSGDPIPGAKLTFYVAGTTTLLTTYSDDAFTTPNTNPVIAGSDGIFPAIFVQSAAFKVVLSDAADNILGTRDNVEPAGGSVAIGAVPDSSFRIAGSSDPTKLLAWEVDGQTAGTTRTRTTIDDDGTEVLQDNAQTLTSKTLTSPVLNGALSGTAFLDDDSFATATATTAASSESIKAYVDAAVFGLKWKEPCAVATTANITLSGEQTIDGVLTAASRVLVKDQSSGAENGIYVSDAGAWSRASDADTGAELEAATVYVTAGTAAADTSWNQTADSITIGVTAIAWVQVSGAGTYTAGNGLTLSSGEFSIDTSVTADRTTAQTLTNKTLTSPAFNGTPTFTADSDRDNFLDAVSPSRQVNVTDDFGAIGDGVRVTDGAITASAATFTSASSSFVTADIGKIISVHGAGVAGANLTTTIASINGSTSVELTANASTTVSSAVAIHGTNNSTALQAALDSGKNVRLPVGRYAFDTQLTFSDGSKLVGEMGFSRHRAAYEHMSYDISALLWAGASGSNTCPVRVSALAVGTEGSDFAAPGTDDLLAFRFEDVHIDAGGADIGCYLYRCGTSSYVNNITVEDSAVTGFLGLGIFTARWGTLGAYANRNKGSTFGIDYFGTWSVGETACYACKIDIVAGSNGTGGTFVEDSGTDADGAGGYYMFGRGSEIGIQSELNDGRAFIIESGRYSAPAIYNVVYIEANGAGPLITYTNNSAGIRLRNGFVHPNDETIKIAGATDDLGPSDPSEWLVIENCFGPYSPHDFTINSNTNKYRVTGSSENIEFSDQHPSPPEHGRDDEDLMVNGNFSVWQRGTSFSANGYTADRWQLALSGATGTVTRQDLTLGALPGLDAPEPKYFARLQTTVANNNAGLDYYIPDVRSYAGKKVFLSFWAKANTDTVGWRVTTYQDFGTGGSPSSDVVVVEADLAVGSTWRRYVVECDFASISGKTIGSNDDSFTRFRFYNTVSETFTMDMACVQVDVGGYGPKAFRNKPEDEEFLRCCSYFQRLTDGTLQRPSGVGQAYSSSLAVFGLVYPVPMRKVPSLTLSSAGHFSVSAATGADKVCGGLALSDQTRLASELTITGASGLVAGNATNLRATNASATFDLDAEL